MKLFLLSILFVSVTSSVSAQFSGDGFYRVQNIMTDRYIYVTDNTGSINIQAMSGDMGAVQLWKGYEKAVSDPASVIYIKKYSDKQYDLCSQGTSVYSLINYYVQVYEKADHSYQVYAEGKYLMDSETNLKSERGYLSVGTKYTQQNYYWNIYPIGADDNYFGLAPTVAVSDRYFKPFYADFAFSFADSGMKAWYVSDIRNGIAIISEINSDIIADNTPVIIECTGNLPSSNRLNLFKSAGTAIDSNMLKGVYFQNEDRAKKQKNPSKDAVTVFDPSTMRVLGVMSNGQLGFVTPDIQYLPANESYLVVPENSPLEMPVLTEGEYELLQQANKEAFDQLAEVFDNVSESYADVCEFISTECPDVVSFFEDVEGQLSERIEGIGSQILYDMSVLALAGKTDYYTYQLEDLSLAIVNLRNDAIEKENEYRAGVDRKYVDEQDIIYDLAGHRLNLIPGKGIYLINGKKVVF